MMKSAEDRPRDWGRVDASDPRWADRPFAGARLCGRNDEGAYTDIFVPGKSLLAKMSETGSFLEVATLTEVVLVSFGSCRGL
jgi:hypothetical protein